MLININKFMKRKGQSTVEYGVLLGVIVGAIIAMQTYLKRSLQAKQKDASDLLTSVEGNIQVGSKNVGTLGTTAQYEPYYLVRHQQRELIEDESENVLSAGGETTSTKKQTSKDRSAVMYKYD